MPEHLRWRAGEAGHGKIPPVLQILKPGGTGIKSAEAEVDEFLKEHGTDAIGCCRFGWGGGDAVEEGGSGCFGQDNEGNAGAFKTVGAQPAQTGAEDG